MEKAEQRSRSQKKVESRAKNVGKVATCYAFPMICGSGGSNSKVGRKVSLLKRGARSHVFRGEMKN